MDTFDLELVEFFKSLNAALPTSCEQSSYFMAKGPQSKTKWQGWIPLFKGIFDLTSHGEITVPFMENIAVLLRSMMLHAYLSRRHAIKKQLMLG